MIRYRPQNQLTLPGFEHPFERDLDPNNRWVKLADALPWDRLARIYMQSLCSDNGRPTIDVRLAVGALIIKHKLSLSDREVVATIQENIYIQYFVGFSSFRPEAAFDPSLFVEMRKRMGAERFDQMSQQIILMAQGGQKEDDSDASTGEGSNDPTELVNKESSVSTIDQSEAQSTASRPNQGHLKLDATVADQMIIYPTDLGLLARSRWESERLIDLLYVQSDLAVKPRTYRRVAHKAYLAVAKKRKKSKRMIRKAIGQQLRYLRRNLATIERLLDRIGASTGAWAFRDYRIYWVIQHIYDQQLQMYTNGVKSHPHRIVNIYQPWVRPIPRGKTNRKVEFGAKLGVSEFNGFSRIDHLSWDAYNESGDLETQVEAYRSMHGYYPKVVLVDQIYLTRSNRAYLKQKGIRHTGPALGRPKPETAYERRRRKKERGMRNHIEGKFGQGKNAYGLRQNRARRKDTSESWLGGIFLALNITTLMKVLNILLIIGLCLVDLFFAQLQTALRRSISRLSEYFQLAMKQGWNYLAYGASKTQALFAFNQAHVIIFNR